MVNTVYVCRSCGYVFAQELSELIENNVQVYCEMCGTPFSLAGVEFKQAPTRFSKPAYSSNQPYSISQKSKSKLANVIKKINKFDDIPIIIFAVIIFGLSFQHLFNPINGTFLFVGQIILGLSAILILIYDSRYISPRIESDGFNSIALDAFCYGILGCIIYGIGVIILIKGILIIIYNIIYQEEEKHKFYNFILKLKNSLNNFSAKAGFVIVLFTLFSIFFGLFNNSFTYMIWDFLSNIVIETDFWNNLVDISIILIGFSIFPIIILLIDFRLQRKIYDKTDLNIGDAIGVFILGIVGSAFFGVGIFILLKAIMLFLLVMSKPIDYKKPILIGEENVIVQTSSFQAAKVKPPEQKDNEEVIQKLEKEKEPLIVEIKPDLEEKPSFAKVVPKGEEFKNEEHIQKETPDIQTVEVSESQKDLPELKLHESLLPVKDDKDKKIVKEYFSKIFNILSKDLRDKIKDLDIPKKDRKELLKEIAFLTEVEQQKYLEILKELYSEFPKKLIERIRKLKNLKPQHYEKVIEQLKYMDTKEQLEFVQFLESNA
jgi:DNA-directed RNA polymerase subunit RPC12/RpoP